VTHGTDFLHYTSAALSFMLKNLNKPVVLTYSQRSTDRGSSDATLNLMCSARAALSDIAEVMLVGHATENDDYCYALQGNKVRKMHASRRDTFKPINMGPIAKITQDKVEPLRTYNKREKAKALLDASFEDKVALIKFYPGQNPDIIDYYIKKKYKGIVVEMSGLGHVLSEGKDNWIPFIKKAINAGIIVCAAPQTIYGALDPMVYEAGRRLEKAGVIYLKDILPETALVKLGYVLGKTKDKKRVEKMLLDNLAGEFNNRLGEEFN
jgi:glutamyl-tRNA(Gln) amidotransferase subunit D